MSRRPYWVLPAILGVGLMHPAHGAQPGSAAKGAIIGSRVLHYAVRCHSDEQCAMECYQGGRPVITRLRVEPDDRVSLAMTDGFSDRLQALWIEVKPASGANRRTILLPRDALCDFQGLTIEPLGQ